MQVIRSKKMTLWIAVMFVAIVGLLVGTGYRNFTEDAVDLAYNKDNLIRLHVVANSDSDIDQALKLDVRNVVLNASGQLLEKAVTIDEAWTILEENLDSLREQAEQRILASGAQYPVSVELGEYQFPTKAYGNFVLAAGTYPAVRVEIGAASGHNWWCVLFPPLCFLNMSGPLTPVRVQQEPKEINEPQVTIELTNPFDLPVKPIPVMAPPLSTN